MWPESFSAIGSPTDPFVVLTPVGPPDPGFDQIAGISGPEHPTALFALLSAQMPIDPKHAPTLDIWLQLPSIAPRKKYWPPTMLIAAPLLLRKRGSLVTCTTEYC